MSCENACKTFVNCNARKNRIYEIKTYIRSSEAIYFKFITFLALAARMPCRYASNYAVAILLQSSHFIIIRCTFTDQPRANAWRCAYAVCVPFGKHQPEGLFPSNTEFKATQGFVSTFCTSIWNRMNYSLLASVIYVINSKPVQSLSANWCDNVKSSLSTNRIRNQNTLWNVRAIQKAKTNASRKDCEYVSTLGHDRERYMYVKCTIEKGKIPIRS